MRSVRILATALLIAAAVAALGEPRPASAQGGRVALVIANAAYPDAEAELPSPVNDAAALSEELTRRGFSVEVAKNLTKQGMQAALDGFMRRIEPGSVALLFYSGYAIQVARKNYLIPVNVRIWSETDVVPEGVGTDKILADAARRGAATRVVVLDASRRNPFERRYRSFSTGLAPAAATPGTLSLYSAAPGSVVAETTATRSLFVAELVKQIGLPGLSAEQAFGATRDALARATRNQQVPAMVSGLEEAFSFDQAYVKPFSPPAKEVKPISDDPGRPQSETKLPPVDPKRPPQSKLPSVVPPDDHAAAGDSTVVAPPTNAGETTPKDDPQGVQTGPATKPLRPPQTASKDPASKDPSGPIVSEEEAVLDFQDAKAIGTKSAYESFIAKHPSGSLAAQARAEIARLEAVPTEPPAEAPVKPFTPAERQRKAALDQRIARNPRDEQAYYERGQFYAQRSDTAAAIADFDQSIRMKPDNPEALNNRCWMRAVASELELAMSDCDQALKLRPAYVDALDSRGFVNLKSSRFRAAIADYDAALKADPGHSSALYGRGIAKRRLGQTGPADKDIASALQLNAAIGDEFAGYGLR